MRGTYNGMLKDPSRPSGRFAGWMFFDDAKNKVVRWLTPPPQSPSSGSSQTLAGTKIAMSTAKVPCNAIEPVTSAPQLSLELVRYGPSYVVRGVTGHPQAIVKYTPDLTRLQGKYNNCLTDTARSAGSFAGFVFSPIQHGAVAEWLRAEGQRRAVAPASSLSRSKRSRSWKTEDVR